MGQVQDIDIIHCYTNSSLEGLFDYVEIHKKIIEDITVLFDKYGLRYEFIRPGGKGGGHALALWEILKLAWIHKDILEAILGLIKFLISIPKRITNTVNKFISDEKPRIYISLAIRTNNDIRYANHLIRRLIYLKYLNDEICNVLKNKYPIFEFDQGFDLTIIPRNFSVNYNIRRNNQNRLNTIRVLATFKNLFIKDNFHIDYVFNKVFTTRIDSDLTIIGPGNMKKPIKKYFLIFSTHLIKDYF